MVQKFSQVKSLTHTHEMLPTPRMDSAVSSTYPANTVNLDQFGQRPTPQNKTTTTVIISPLDSPKTGKHPTKTNKQLNHLVHPTATLERLVQSFGRKKSLTYIHENALRDAPTPIRPCLAQNYLLHPPNTP